MMRYNSHWLARSAAYHLELQPHSIARFQHLGPAQWEECLGCTWSGYEWMVVGRSFDMNLRCASDRVRSRENNSLIERYCMRASVGFYIT